MPVIPNEGKSGDDLSDKISEMEDNLLSSKSNDQMQKRATVQDHQANPGPVIADSSSFEPAASTEELKKRAEELNK